MHSSSITPPASCRPAARLFVPPMRLLLLGLLLFVLSAPLCAAATTYYVSPSGNDNNAGTLVAPFKTIQQAFNNAVNGDTVTLEDGTYTGTGDVDLSFASKNITVNSVNGATKTIIDCGGTNAANHGGFSLQNGETNAFISGITIKNASQSAVSIGSGSTATLTGCTITGNPGGGVSSGGTATLTGCTITGNIAPNSNGGGISNSGTLTVTSCTITGNTASYTGNAEPKGIGGGVYNLGSLILTNCTISGNTASSGQGGGVSTGYTSGFGSTGTAIVMNCTISGNTGSGFYNDAAATLTNCTISSNAGNGVGNGLASTETLTGCNISGNIAQDGAGVSNDGTVMLTNCTISSNTANYDGGGGVGNSGTATLMGCTITKNTAYLGGQANIFTNDGGGFWNDGTGTLTNCTISGNTTSGGQGGGIYNDDGYGGTVTLTNCTISGNAAAAGNGGGIDNQCDRGSVALTNCVVANNIAGKGGGVYYDYSSVTAPLTDCTISGNTANNGNGGGVYIQDDKATLTNCAITGNTANNGNGGGIWYSSNDGTVRLTLQFCTLSANSTVGAGAQGGALEIDNESLIFPIATLENDILWGNTAPNATEIGATTPSSPVPAITYSDIQGGLSGTGNLNKDPLFVNPAASDFHLKAGSPCIGAGTPISGVATDLDGKTRANPPTIGCYEGAETGAATSHTHLLWNNTDGRVMLWSIAPDGTFTLNGFGPYTDNAPQNVWHATAVATGPDGKSHILWNNTDGRVMLWTVDDAGNFTLAGYGPYTDNAPQNIWHAVAVSVGPDNIVHLLWSNTDHRAMFWNVAPDFSFTLAGYGPYTDNASQNLWTATALATGPDNLSHIVWNNTDGRVMLWNVDPSFSFTLAGYGPYTDGAPQNLWSAVGVSVGPDNTTHLLWSNTDRRAMFWNVAQDFSFTLAGYGPYTDNAPQNLWTATALATGPDNMSHLLWDNTDYRAMLWGVDNSFNFTVAGYGPYTDNAPQNLWSATAVSAGP